VTGEAQEEPETAGREPAGPADEAMTGGRSACPDDELVEVQGFIDEPDGRHPVARGPLVIRGWAYEASSAVSTVDLSLDGRRLGRAGIGRPRPDVAAYLGDGDAELSGFELTTDLSGLDAVGATALLRTHVTLLSGARRQLPPVALMIEGQKPAHIPPAAEPSRRTLRPSPTGRWSRRGSVRVLWFARSLDRGGSQLRLCELINYLSNTGGFESTVAAPGDGPLRRALEASGAAVRAVPSPSMADLEAYDAEVAEMASSAADSFDIVVGTTLTCFRAIEVAERLGLPSVWRIGEAERVRTVVRWLYGDLDPGVEERSEQAFTAASVVLFNSYASLRTCRRAGFEGCWAVLRTGVDITGARAYLAANDRDATRRALGVAPGQRLLVLAATIWPVKGQALLVSALGQLEVGGRGLACALVGHAHPDYAGAISRFVDRHSLETVKILPFCEDMRPWWCAADVAVCASETESLPSSILEAMSFGVPVLASRVGDLPSIVQPGVTGWLCDPADVASMLACLEEVSSASDSDLRALGGSAARRVAEDHDSADVLGRTAELIALVARGSQPGWLGVQV